MEVEASGVFARGFGAEAAAGTAFLVPIAVTATGFLVPIGVRIGLFAAAGVVVVEAAFDVPSSEPDIIFFATGTGFLVPMGVLAGATFFTAGLEAAGVFVGAAFFLAAVGDVFTWLATLLVPAVWVVSYDLLFPSLLRKTYIEGQRSAS